MGGYYFALSNVWSGSRGEKLNSEEGRVTKNSSWSMKRKEKEPFSAPTTFFFVVVVQCTKVPPVRSVSNKFLIGQLHKKQKKKKGNKNFFFFFLLFQLGTRGRLWCVVFPTNHHLTTFTTPLLRNFFFFFFFLQTPPPPLLSLPLQTLLPSLAPHNAFSESL